MRIAINGFGRIGESIFKILLERKMNVVAINAVHGVKDAAYTVKYDSVYGKFNGKVSTSGNDLIVNGKRVKVISERDIEKLPWKKLDVDLVLECTGKFRKPEEAEAHLKAGAKKMLLSAPPKGDTIGTYLVGVNDNELKDETMFSNASCTTNCVGPITKVMVEKFGNY